MNSNCSNLLNMRNLQEQVKKAFCYQKLFWPVTVWKNCSSNLKFFENSRHSASSFKDFSRSLEQFFLTVGQNNFGNKIPFLLSCILFLSSWHFSASPFPWKTQRPRKYHLKQILSDFLSIFFFVMIKIWKYSNKNQLKFSKAVLLIAQT